MRTRLLAAGFLPVLLVASVWVPQIGLAQMAPSMGAADFYGTQGVIPTMDPASATTLETRSEAIQVVLDANPENAKFLDRFRAHPSTLPLFADVPTDSAFGPYAEVAYMKQFTSGFADKTLRPNDPIPAEEAVVITMKSFGIAPIAGENDVADYVPYIRGAMSRNLIADPRSMSVGQSITRAQFLDIVFRAQVVADQRLAAFPVMPTQAPAAPTQPIPAVSAPVVRQPVQQVQQYVPMQASVIPVPQAQPVQRAVAPVASATASADLLQYASNQAFSITIPALGIKNLSVSDPVDAASHDGVLGPLQNGVGHLFSYPGSNGKIMIYGHSSGYSWDVSKFTKIFRTVNKLHGGDMIYVTYRGALFVYAVTGQQTISPSDTGPFRGAGEELILYTCWPPNSIKQRLIVRASPVTVVALR